MNTSQEHVIPFNRKKILSIMRTQIFLIAFFSLGLYEFIVKPMENSALVNILAISLITFMVFALLFSIRKLNDHSPGLIINPLGIIDNSTSFAVGSIPWANIINVYVTKARSTRWLTIKIYNPERYYSNENIFVRILQILNQTFFGSAVHISAGFLDIRFDEMADIIEQYHREYSQKQ